MMAKRKASRRAKARTSGRNAAAPPRSGKRPTKKAGASRKTAARKTAPARNKDAAKRSASGGGAAGRTVDRRTTKPFAPSPRPGKGIKTKASPRIDRIRRTLEDAEEPVPTPPSSLDLDRHPSAARTGRAELAESLQKHPGMTPALTGGDVDANWENAYFSGDEAPGGDNPTPDQDIVDDIGKALGVEYQDNEELKAVDKVVERDKHRWELDPASAEDYKNRK